MMTLLQVQFYQWRADRKLLKRERTIGTPFISTGTKVVTLGFNYDLVSHSNS
jgi:hypothetical protein